MISRSLKLGTGFFRKSNRLSFHRSKGSKQKHTSLSQEQTNLEAIQRDLQLIATNCPIQNIPFLQSNASEGELPTYDALGYEHAYTTKLQACLAKHIDPVSSIECNRAFYYTQIQTLALKTQQISYFLKLLGSYSSLIQAQRTTISSQKQQIAELEDALDQLDRNGSFLQKSSAIEQQMNSLFTEDENAVQHQKVSSIGIHTTPFEDGYNCESHDLASGSQISPNSEDLSKPSLHLENYTSEYHQLEVEGYACKMDLLSARLNAHERFDVVRQRRIQMLETQLQLLLKAQNAGRDKETDSISDTIDDRTFMSQMLQFSDLETRFQSILDLSTKMPAELSAKLQSWEQVNLEREKYKHDYQEVLFLYNSLTQDTEKVQWLANSNILQLRQREADHQREFQELKLESRKTRQKLEDENANLITQIEDLTREIEFYKATEVVQGPEPPKGKEISDLATVIDQKFAAQVSSVDLSAQLAQTEQDYQELLHYIEELEEVKSEGQASLQRVMEMERLDHAQTKSDLLLALNKISELQAHLESSKTDAHDAAELLQVEADRNQALEERVRQLLELVGRANKRFEELVQL